MRLDPQIDIIMRAHEERQLPELRRAVRSVAEQIFDHPVRILLETSNFGKKLSLPDLVEEELCPPTLSFMHHDVPYAHDSRFVLLRSGIERATAPWLYFLDCDDCLKPLGLSTLWQAGEESGAHLVIANVDLVTNAGKRVSRAPYRQGPVSTLSLLKHNTVPFNAILVAREAAVTAIADSPALSLFEDYGLVLSLLSQAPPHVLPHETTVAEYHAGTAQSTKYGVRRAFSLATIEKHKASLTFPIHGADLISKARDPVREQADATLLAALPEVPLAATPVEGFVEYEPMSDGTVRLDGWCQNSKKPKDPIFAVYAALDPKHAVLLSERSTRSDVNMARKTKAEKQGFSGTVPDSGNVTVWIVHDGKKSRLPKPF
ncbi:hypothetical protein [Cognatishimia sp. F0-27]|uniref:hypothetical protein n=1 Tax=Cognatishimia sp. F0-27 TaxID=2816855 RepID=UPI001D0C67D0|nr:hypothetical protein [Cognatishimia sp. F0-27]MCC1494040.1 hypothetical protein [Cognatishimia sp. F0-27]